MSNSDKKIKKVTKIEPVKLSRQAPFKIQDTRSAPLKSRPKKTDK